MRTDVQLREQTELMACGGSTGRGKTGGIQADVEAQVKAKEGVVYTDDGIL